MSGHNQYLNVYLDNKKNEYCCRYINNEGEVKLEVHPFYSEIYISSDNSAGSNHRTISSVPLKPVLFGQGQTKEDYINTIKSYLNSGIDVYGSSNPLHSFMCKKFSYHEGSHDRWKYACFDIEVETDGKSFPNSKKAQFPINAISLLFENTVYLLYWYDKEPDVKKDIISNKDKFGVSDVILIHASSEQQMLKAFCSLVAKLDPDVIGGWNTDRFDWPYIINRMKLLFGHDQAISYLKKMSPFGRVNIVTLGKETDRLIIVGRSVIDFMKFYKKLVVSPRPNYSLDTIANIETGMGKLETPSGLSGWELWKHEKYYDLFFKYCIIDTIRAHQVMVAAGLYDLINSIAFFTHCNIEDVEYTSRVWLSLLYSYLWNKGIVPHIGRNVFHSGGDNDKIIGGFTSEPEKGLHDWVVSFDLTSLYPSIMMSLNISSDTLIDDRRSSMGFLDQKKAMEKSEVCVAANGAKFTKAYVGAFPLILRDLFEERKKAKQQMLSFRKKGDNYKAHIMKVRQSALKVLLNSAYGCIASRYFPHYSFPVAEAVTTTGRVVVQEMASAVNEACKKLGSPNNSVIYCDTDSSYFSLGFLVKDKFGHVKINDKQIISKVVKYVDAISSRVISPIIHRRFDKIARETFNAYENRFSAKREIIAYKALFIAKKKYTALVLDDEGVSHISDGGKLKIVGLEANKPTHAPLAVEILKDIYKAILFGKDVNDIIVNGWVKWKKCDDPAMISVSVYVNKLDSNSGISKAAQNYNFLIDAGIIKSFNRKITDGDKVHWCYCVRSNQFGIDKIAWPVDSEFPLSLSVIDYKKQFETLVISPTDIVLTPIGKKVSNYENVDIGDELW